MATVTVGPTGTYSTHAQAILAAVSGDIIEVDPTGGPYINSPTQATLTKNLWFKSKTPGTQVKLTSNEWPANDKGYFIIQATVVFEWYEMTGVTSYLPNIAALRFESGDLTLIDSWVHGYYGNGILASPVGDTSGGGIGTITLTRSEFNNLGASDALSHLAYVGRVAKYTVNACFFHDMNGVNNSDNGAGGNDEGGNLFKCRSQDVEVNDSRIFSNSTKGVWQMDFPNGGKIRVTNTIIQQGVGDVNTNMLSMGVERDSNGPNWSVSNAIYDGCTFINDMVNTGSLLANPFGYSVTFTNSKLWVNNMALPSGMTGNIPLTSRPVLDQSHPFTLTDDPDEGDPTPPGPVLVPRAVASLVPYQARTAVQTKWPKPAGSVTGDRTFVFNFAAAAGGAPAYTPPAGFLPFAGNPAAVYNDGGFAGGLYGFYHDITDADASVTTWSPGFSGSHNNEAVVVSVPGCKLSSVPTFSVPATEDGSNGTVATANSVTTASNGSIVFDFMFAWQNVAGVTPAAGWTALFNNSGQFCVTYKDIASAGPTGTVSQSIPNSGTSDGWGAWMVAQEAEASNSVAIAAVEKSDVAALTVTAGVPVQIAAVEKSDVALLTIGNVGNTLTIAALEKSDVVAITVSAEVPVAILAPEKSDIVVLVISNTGPPLPPPLQSQGTPDHLSISRYVDISSGLVG